ncbi:MAG TPA: ABC transporter permease, partial [Candidatus Angelobacter sp.]|nr:ABC transporter permease [Candidatus Angelobacter sp.]
MSLFSRFANVFRSDRLDRELQEELESHLQMRAEENVRAGMSGQAADEDARRRFGNQMLLLEHTRQVRIVHWLETFLQDVRYGFRSLRRAPGFTITAVLTMVLSIGAVTAVFTLVESILLRPLPYPHAEQLLTLATFMPRMHAEITSSPDYFAWRDNSRVLTGVAAYGIDNVNFSGAGDPDQLQSASTTANFFDVLGIQPLIGRAYTPEEDRPEAPGTMVLSYSLWQERFHGDPNVIGAKVVVEGEPTTVIGVMPPNFRFPDSSARPDFLAPMRVREFKADVKSPMRIVQVVARSKPGTPLQSVKLDVQTVSDQLISSFPGGFKKF